MNTLIILLYIFFLFLIGYSIFIFKVTKNKIKKFSESTKLLVNQSVPTSNFLIELSENTKILTYDPGKKLSPEEKKLFWIDYFNLIREYTCKASKSIIILDYLDNQKSLEIKGENESLNDVYDSFFEELEYIVKERNIKYTRILQLPLDNKIYDGNTAALIESMSLMYSKKREHLNRMINNSNFKLHCLSTPIRTNSILIVDEKFLLSEYDKYGPDKIAHPDTLLVNKNGSTEYQTLINIRINEINSIINEKDSITVKDFEYVKNNVGKILSGQKFILEKRITEILRYFSQIQKLSEKIIDQNLVSDVLYILNSAKHLTETLNKKNLSLESSSSLINQMKKSINDLEGSLATKPESKKKKHPVPHQPDISPEKVEAAVKYLGTQWDEIVENKKKILGLNEIKALNP